jgi:hypothetical protein
MSAVQTPPAASGDPLHEGVRVQEPDFWGLICDLTLALGDTPLEEIIWRYELGDYTFILNSTGEIANTNEARILGILECRVLYRMAGGMTLNVMRVSPWECEYCHRGHDYNALGIAIEVEIERLLELDKAEL